MQNSVIVITDDIDVFETLADAERYLEPFLLRSPGFSVLDCSGRQLSAVVQTRGLAQVVRLVDDPQAKPDESRVRDVLKHFLERFPEAANRPLSGLSVEQLFDLALQLKAS